MPIPSQRFEPFPTQEAVPPASPITIEATPSVPEPESLPAPPSTPESLWEFPGRGEGAASSTPPPESQVFLMARDPLSLVAHWHLADSDVERVRVSADRHLVLRISEAAPPHRLCALMHLPGDRRVQEIQVRTPDCEYRAELGAFSKSGDWYLIATSVSSRTPACVPARAPNPPEPTPETSLPETVGLQPSAESATKEDGSDVGPNDARPANASGLSTVGAHRQAAPESKASGTLTPQEARGLEEPDLVQRLHAQLLARGPSHPSSGDSPAAPDLRPNVVSSPQNGFQVVSSQAPGLNRPDGPGLWFNVQTDLIVHGAAEPGARVVIAGKEVALRPDGTFTLRLALPDGEFVIDAQATSADGRRSGEARLRVQRVLERR